MSLQDNPRQQAIEALNSGRLLEAKTQFQQIIAADPDDPQAWHKLGAINGQLGLMEEAEAACRRALAIDPLFVDAHLDLGNILYSRGRLDEALRCYREALRLKPDYLMALHNIGNILDAMHRIDEAVECYETVLRIEPSPLTFYNLGNLLLKEQKLDEAIHNFRQALRLNPNFAKAYNNLGNALRYLGREDEAAECFEKVVTLQPNFTAPYVNLGVLLTETGQYDKALLRFRQALDIDPELVTAKVGEARTLENQGEFEQASARLQQLLDSGISSPEVALLFSSLCRHMRRCDEAIAMMENILKSDSASLDTYNRTLLHFELGRALDAAGEFDRAFSHFEQGNMLKTRTFDSDVHARDIDDTIQTFNKDFMRTAPRATIDSQRPIFIVGVPRSGTSLVEQILASHPQIFGGGEMVRLFRIVDDLPETLGANVPYPQCISMLTIDACNRISRQYQDRLESLSKDALRVTDKMPANFKYLGLIALLFPQAKVIHCVRNPLDTCLSCYFQNFSSSNSYAYDLENLGAYYRHYQRLMRHWEDVLDIAILKVEYEKLVSDMEKISRSMIEFCGLDWDERCLRFYDTQRVVTTASYNQVRQPLYNHSVNRWKHYERHIEPLKRALDGN